MVIEIFADNLRKSDTVNNSIHVKCKLIVVNDGKVFVWNRKKDNLYFFPSESLKKNETEADCIKRLQLMTCPQDITSKKTITIKEYFPENSYINHYYLLELPKPDVNSSENEAVATMWYDVLDLLTLFEQYDGLDPHGTEIYEREFIALVNSI